MKIINRIIVYAPLCWLAAKTMWQVLREGETKYPNVDADAVICKRDHAAHAKEHIDCYRELGCLDDLTHCACRCILDLANRYRTMRLDAKNVHQRGK